MTFFFFTKFPVLLHWSQRTVQHKSFVQSFLAQPLYKSDKHNLLKRQQKDKLKWNRLIWGSMKSLLDLKFSCQLLASLHSVLSLVSCPGLEGLSWLGMKWFRLALWSDYAVWTPIDSRYHTSHSKYFTREETGDMVQSFLDFRQPLIEKINYFLL